MPPSFGEIRLSVHQKIFKIDFQDGRLGFPIGTILAVLDLQVTPILLIKVRVSWPFNSGDGGRGSNLGFLIEMIFSYFWSAGCSDTSCQVSNHLAIPIRSSKYFVKMAANLKLF